MYLCLCLRVCACWDVCNVYVYIRVICLCLWVTNMLVYLWHNIYKSMFMGYILVYTFEFLSFLSFFISFLFSFFSFLFTWHLQEWFPRVYVWLPNYFGISGIQSFSTVNDSAILIFSKRRYSSIILAHTKDIRTNFQGKLCSPAHQV